MIVRVMSLAALVLAAALPPTGAAQETPPPLPEIEQVCDNGKIAVETGFTAARLTSCRFLDSATLELTIAPEDAPPINCSPWYAFRLRALDDVEHRLTLRFRYTACEHRYHPKRSTDWREWTPLEAAGGDASFTLSFGELPVYVSAQEILPPATYAAWMRQLADRGSARLVEFGTSRQGRPLAALAFGNPDAEKLVLVLGRQHPPEVSGSKSLFGFVETLAGDSAQMAAYNREVLTLVVPLLNPDGVVAGNWRHATGGVDLNRDWGKYTQPETRAVRDLLHRYLERGHKLSLLLDFHSTGRDVLYTLSEETGTDPPRLVQDWIAALHRRTPDFTFALAPGYSAGSGVAKNHFYERYGIPAVTVEFGDEADRQAAALEGQAAALALAEVFAARR